MCLLFVTVSVAQQCSKRDNRIDNQCSYTDGQANMGIVIEVRNITNVRSIDINRIKSALAENGVVVIKNQHLTRQQQVDFTSTLGNVIVLPSSFEGKDREMGFPEIQRITNYWFNGTWKGHRSCHFGCYWHKDGDFQHNGYLASVLYADEVTKNVSTTQFLDNCEVYYKLSRPNQEKLSRAIFKVSVRDIPDFSRGTEEDFSLFPQDKLHNGIYQHPQNGRTCAYVTSYFITPNGVASDLHTVWTEVVEKSAKYVHSWTKGDVVIWDNLAVMHRAGTDGAKASGKGTPRMLFRTQAFL